MADQNDNLEVFANRLNVVSESRKIDRLGHVFAHEIGHILQRMAGPSATLLMKADWSAQDYCAWKGRRCPLDPGWSGPPGSEFMSVE